MIKVSKKFQSCQGTYFKKIYQKFSFADLNSDLNIQVHVPQTVEKCQLKYVKYLMQLISLLFVTEYIEIFCKCDFFA